MTMKNSTFLIHLILQEGDMMDKVAVLGPKGTFSDQAFQKFNQDQLSMALYYANIEECFEALDDELCSFAIVPIENTLDGYVQQTLDLLLEKPYHIQKELLIPVQFSLIAYANSLTDIRTLYVQFVTKGQCHHFLKQLRQTHQITTESNMESFHLVKNFGDAAIIPHHMFKKHDGFGIADVTDTSENYTRFLVLGKPEQHFNDGHFKASLVVTPIIDRPGLLFDILKIFADQKINLISIMSRPTKKEIGRYHFFIELEGESKQKYVLEQSLKEIRKIFQVKLLGVYPEQT